MNTDVVMQYGNCDDVDSINYYLLVPFRTTSGVKTTNKVVIRIRAHAVSTECGLKLLR